MLQRSAVLLILCLCASWAALSTPASMQARFVDDAKREVQLPASVSRVFATGAPAEVLLYTLVPEMLVGRNRLPEGEAIEFFVDNPAAGAELLAIKPDVYIDYHLELTDQQLQKLRSVSH